MMNPKRKLRVKSMTFKFSCHHNNISSSSNYVYPNTDIIILQLIISDPKYYNFDLYCVLRAYIIFRYIYNILYYIPYLLYYYYIIFHELLLYSFSTETNVRTVNCRK